MSKLKKALKVAKDLDTLEFTAYSADDKMPHTLDHPTGRYTIWIANGFWFVALYELDGKFVDRQHNISKFGAIGKCIVWWKCRKHIRKWRADRKDVETRIISGMFE